MTTKVNITSDALSKHRVIVHISNDASTILLSPGESIEYALSQGMCINLIESEEDYSHGEGEDSSGVLAGTFPFPGTDETVHAGSAVPSHELAADTPLEFSPKEGE